MRSPQDAWGIAVSEIFPKSETAQKKGCPRGAFLGLCEEGLLVGVLPGTYTKSRDNKQYAIDAVKTLKHQPDLADDRNALWRRIMKGVAKKENQQMDVVVALWNGGFIVKNKV